MPQPQALEDLGEPLRQAYANAWQRVVAEQESLASDPLRLARSRRLAEMRARIEEQLDDLEKLTNTWVRNTFPRAYMLGGQTAAGQTLTDFTWGQIHEEAVQRLAEGLWKDLLGATKGVRETTKDLIRTVSRDESLQAAIEGRTAKQAGAEMRRILEAKGVHAVTYKDGSRHGLKEYSEMAQRSQTAIAYNEGTLNQGELAGVVYWEVFDGPTCGWTFHDDTTLASGLLVTREEALSWPISHPNCRRTFGPRPDVPSKSAAKKAGPTPTEGQKQAQLRADQELPGSKGERHLRDQLKRGLFEDRDLSPSPSAPAGLGEELVRTKPAEWMPDWDDSFKMEGWWSTEYKKMNGKLRKSPDGWSPRPIAKDGTRGDIYLFGTEDDYIARADDVLSRSTTTEDTTVFRAVGRNKKPPAWLDKLQPGDEFVDRGFVSTSLDPDGFGVTKGPMAEIRVPKGTHGYFNPNPDTLELTLDRGLTYRVASREVRDGQDWLILEVTPGAPTPHRLPQPAGAKPRPEPPVRSKKVLKEDTAAKNRKLASRALRREAFDAWQGFEGNSTMQIIAARLAGVPEPPRKYWKGGNFRKLIVEAREVDLANPPDTLIGDRVRQTEELLKSIRETKPSKKIHYKAMTGADVEAWADSLVPGSDIDLPLTALTPDESEASGYFRRNRTGKRGIRDLTMVEFEDVRALHLKDPVFNVDISESVTGGKFRVVGVELWENGQGRTVRLAQVEPPTIRKVPTPKPPPVEPVHPGVVKRTTTVQKRVDKLVKRGTVTLPDDVPGLTAHLDDLRARLKAAPGGGARARIKAKIAEAEEKLKGLGGGEPTKPPAKPAPPKLKPGPTPKPVNPGLPDLPDFSDVPSVEEILKGHFGWTRKIAERDQLRIKLGRLPTVEQIRKNHPGWTTARAQKELDKLKAHVGGGAAPPKPPTLKPPPKTAPEPPPAPKKADVPAPVPKNAHVSEKIAAIRARYESELVGDVKRAGDVETHKLHINVRMAISEAARHDPELTEALEEVFGRRLMGNRAPKEAWQRLVDAADEVAKKRGLDLREGDWLASAKRDLDALVSAPAMEGAAQAGPSTKKIHDWLASKVTGLNVEQTNVLFGGYQPAASRIDSSITEAVAWYTRVMDRRLYDRIFKKADGRSNGNITATWSKMSGSRASYSSGRSLVNVGGGKTATVVHELGHHIEFNAGRRGGGGWASAKSDLMADAASFRGWRAAGRSRNAPLPKPTTIYRGTDERGWKDEFITHYTGRDYGDASTEVVSVGLEYMYKNPGELLRKDPEHFWFMVGILSGEIP